MARHAEDIAGLLQLLGRFETGELAFDDGDAMAQGVQWVLDNLVEVHLPGPVFDTELEGLARIAGFDLDHPDHREVLAAGTTLAAATGVVRVMCGHERPSAFCERLRNPDPSWLPAGERMLAGGAFEESLAVRAAQRQLAQPAYRRHEPHRDVPATTDTRGGMR